MHCCLPGVLLQAADITQALQKAFRKDRKVRSTVPEASSTQATQVSASEGVQARRPMNFMEDEDEVIEHKSIAGYHGGRRESKKTIPALTVRTRDTSP